MKNSNNQPTENKNQKHPAVQEFERLEQEAEKNMKSQTYSTTPLKKRQLFDPESTYYEAGKGRYFMDVDTHFRDYTRKSPVKQGIKRFLDMKGVPYDLEEIMTEIEIDKAIDWAGSIAGFKRGMNKIHGKNYLVLDEANLTIAKKGECPLHLDLIKQAFPLDDARLTFLSWLRDAYLAVLKHSHHPAPMLVMAGERNAGKSLLALITKEILGGRSSNPMTSWSGKLPWNDDILRAELLLIDDSEASTDPRARKNLGSRFKEAIYSGNVQINKRNNDGMSFRPVWRVMICCNETPENLAIIPPLEDGITDKIILMRVNRINMPRPAKTVEEKQALRDELSSERAAFIHYLTSIETPEHLTDERDGVTAWKDPSLLESIKEISPEHKLESMIQLCLEKDEFNMNFNIKKGESRYMTASEIESALTHIGSPTHIQAKELLKYHANCGRYLSTLLKTNSRFITGSKLKDGITTYCITRPSGVME